MSIKCVYCATASTSPFCKLSELTTRQLISNRKIVIYFKFFVLGILGPTNEQKHGGVGGGGAFAGIDLFSNSLSCYSYRGNFSLQPYNCPWAALWIKI